VEKDEAAHRAVIDAQGRDSRGNGTARATVTATLVPDGDQATTVTVLTDLNITGKPAQFGRGVLVDVGNKLIGQFADCLAGKLTGADTLPPADETAPGDGAPVGSTPMGSKPAGSEPVDSAEQPAVAGPGAAATAEPAALSGGPGPGTAEADYPDGAASAAGAPAAETHRQPTRHAAPETEPIDLLGSAGPALVKRLAPIAVPALAVLLFVILRRRR
jgi:hypothetical protein